MRPAADPTSFEALLKHWLVVLAATLPAFAVFFAISAEKRAYEPHYRFYRLMGVIFGRALNEASAIPAGREFQELMRDLGREALAEECRVAARSPPSPDQASVEMVMAPADLFLFVSHVAEDREAALAIGPHVDR